MRDVDPVQIPSQRVPVGADQVLITGDRRHKMGELNVVVRAVAEDGYQVALSWAEIDPEFGACAALLATRYNGTRLSRPTLVTPCDGRASRCVRDPWQLRLLSMTPAGPEAGLVGQA